MRMPATRKRAVAALLAGALPVFSFPAPALWWLAYVALVPWLLLLRTAPTGRRAAFEGWLGGTGFLLAVHSWLVPNLHVFIVLLAALLGLLWAPWGWLVRALLGATPSLARAAAAVAVLPSGWLMIELVRSWQGLGGPWGLLGASQWQVSPALRLASVGGVWLVSLLVVAVNTAVTVAIALPRARLAGVAAVVLCALVTGAVAAWAPRPQITGHARIAVVQPGVIPGADRRLAREEELTRTLAGQRLDLVVWGESSVGEDLYARPGLTADLAALSRDVGADLLVNVDARRAGATGADGGIYKSSVLIGPQGLTGQRYDKMRLVPFGEYVPLRPVLGWVTSVGRAARENRLRGTHQVVMDLPGGGPRIGPLICFETAFPDMSRSLARKGAQLLVAQSSTSTFQDSWAPAQHASLGALRAAETGRSMVHSTLTGISAAYAPDGARVGRWLPVHSSTVEVFEVPVARGTTPFVRYGDWAVYGALGMLAALGAAVGVRRFSGPGRGR
ncbi:apolipoprotein N-acyltransferase [Streptomyces sp. NPDC017979]|uniref:apolipoprotein N-acyltransferase n=1 Tax=Streptomyces sp. NPDC017979 TaxID=3365024 RepID=UPI0037B459AA